MKIQEALLLLGFALIGLALTLDLQAPVLLSFQKDYLPADTYARILAVALGCSALLALAAVPFGRQLSPTPLRPRHPVPLQGMLLSALYLIGVSYIGFFVSSAAYLAALALLFSGEGKKELVPALVYALLVSGTAKILFGVFKVYLPNAWLF